MVFQVYNQLFEIELYIPTLLSKDGASNSLSNIQLILQSPIWSWNPIFYNELPGEELSGPAVPCLWDKPDHASY